MSSDEMPPSRFLRQLLPPEGSEISRQILLHREPNELTKALFETYDCLMNCLDAAWKMQAPQLYDEVYELLAKTAAMIDKSRP